MAGGIILLEFLHVSLIALKLLHLCKNAMPFVIIN